MLRVLLDEKRQFETQRRNHEHPIDKQDGPARTLGRHQVVKHG